jgi:hypothetical protein|tara:strand:- start:3016 stop:3411 length:396 start_codon:yes stop_codon:yes gene_type:complete
MSKDSNEGIGELLDGVNSYIRGYKTEYSLKKLINLYHGKSLQLLLWNINFSLLHTRMTTIQKARASEVIIIINRVPTFRTVKSKSSDSNSTGKNRRRGSSHRSTGGIGRKNRTYRRRGSSHRSTGGIGRKK